MREETIIGGLSTNANNLARLYQSLVQIDARRQAFERVASKRWALLEAILSPRSFWGRVDVETNNLMASHEQQMREAAEAMEAQRKKPKITLVRP